MVGEYKIKIDEEVLASAPKKKKMSQEELESKIKQVEEQVSGKKNIDDTIKELEQEDKAKSSSLLPTAPRQLGIPMSRRPVEQTSDFQVEDSLMKVRDVITHLPLEETLEQESIESETDEQKQIRYDSTQDVVNYGQREKENYTPESEIGRSSSREDAGGYSASGGNYDASQRRAEGTMSRMETYDPTNAIQRENRREFGEISANLRSNLETEASRSRKKDNSGFTPITGY